MKIKYILLAFVFVAAMGSCKKDENETEPVTTDTIKAPEDTTSNNNTSPDSLTEDNMLMGNPSNAITNIAAMDNYLMIKHQYTLSYNSSRGTANWVSWHLSTGWKGNQPRCNCFTADANLPGTFYITQPSDYTSSGYDRGHLCPSDDRDKNYADNYATFLMTNIIPQTPQLNQQTWNDLELYCTTLMNQGNELYIISGGYGVSDTIGTTNHVVVPSDCWKVIVVLPNGSNDVSRVSTSTRVIAVMMPNTTTVGNQWGNYRVSIDSIEALTGFDFLSVVSTSLQTTIENAVDTGPTQ